MIKTITNNIKKWWIVKGLLNINEKAKLYPQGLKIKIKL